MQLDTKLVTVGEPHEPVEACTGICWLAENHPLLTSDLKKVLLGQSIGLDQSIIPTRFVSAYELDGFFITCLAKQPASTIDGTTFTVGTSQANLANTLALGATDGSLIILQAEVRNTESEEPDFICKQRVSATPGNSAIIKIAWTHDGSSLVTASEDGSINVWSRSGDLRSTLQKSGKVPHSIAWSPSGTRLAVAQGSGVRIIPINPAENTIEFNVASSSIVTALSWSMEDTIVIGTESGVVRVFDSTGHRLRQPVNLESPITSLCAFNTGGLIAVGTRSGTVAILNIVKFLLLAITDLGAGAVYDLSLAPDGLTLAAACARGAAGFIRVTGIAKRFGTLEIVQRAPNTITLCDLETLTEVELEPSSKAILNFSLVGQNRLVVLTEDTLFIYTRAEGDNNSTHWQSHPSQARWSSGFGEIIGSSNFITVSTPTDVKVFDAVGTNVCKLDVQLKGGPACISGNMFICAIGRVLKVFELPSGRVLSPPDPSSMTHSSAIVALESSHIPVHCSTGTRASEYMFSILDANRDLRIASSSAPWDVFQIASAVRSVRWCEDAPVCAYSTNSRVMLCLAPHVGIVDDELVDSVQVEVRTHGDVLSDASISAFDGTIDLALQNGAIIHLAPDVALVELARRGSDGNHSGALKCARIIDSRVAWSVLSVYSLDAGSVSEAIAAAASLRRLAQVAFLNRLSQVRLPALKQAMLLLMRGRKIEAESVLVNGGLIYWAIRNHLDTGDFISALQLAVKSEQYLDVVLVARWEYLRALGVSEETDEAFLQYSGVSVSEANVHEIIEKEQREAGFVA